MKKYIQYFLVFLLMIFQISALILNYINDQTAHNLTMIITVFITYIIITIFYIKAKKEQKKFSTIFEESIDGIALINKNTQRIHIANAAMNKMLEYSKEEIQDLYLADIVNEKNFNETMEEFSKLKENESLQSKSAFLETKYKHEIEVDITGKISTINKKQYILIITRNISKTAKQEKEIKKLKSIYEAAINASRNVLYNWDSITNNVTYMGPTLKMLGYTCKEMDGDIDKWRNLIHPEDLTYFDIQLKKILNTNLHADLEYRIRKKDGTYVYIEDTGNFIKEDNGNNSSTQMVGFIKDISTRKKADQSKMEISAKFCTLSGNNFFEKIARHIATSLGVDHVFIGRLIKGNNIKVLGGVSKNETMQSMEYNLEGTPCENVVGKQMCIYESNVQNDFPKDTILKEMKIEGYIGNPLFNEKNEAIGLIVALSEKKIDNQTDQIQILKIFTNQISNKIELINAEEELKKHQNKLNTITKNSIPIIFMINKKGEFTLSEGKGLEKLGLKPKEVVGKSAFKIYKDYPEIIEGIEKALDGEQITNQVKINNKYGKSFWRTLYSPITNEKHEVTGLIGTAIDITPEQELEKIIEKQKITSDLVQCGLIEINKEGGLIEKNHKVDELIKNGTPIVDKNNKIHPGILEKIQNSKGIGGINIKIKILDKEFTITWSEYLKDQNTIIAINEDRCEPKSSSLQE